MSDKQMNETAARELLFRQYAGRIFMDGNPSDLVRKIPATLLSKFPDELRDMFDFILLDLEEHGSVSWERCKKKSDAGDAPYSFLDSVVGLITSDDPHNLLDMETIEGQIRQSVEAFNKAYPTIFEPLQKLLANQGPRQWLVKGLIEAPSTGVFFGASGTGKSFVAIDLAACCASGADWNGRPVKAGSVFYIAAEGQTGVKRRLRAWQIDRGIILDRFFLSTIPVEMNTAHAALIGAEIENHARTVGKPALIVIDTLARTMPAGDSENDTGDMCAFVRHVDQIRDRLGCVALIIHHTGVADDKRARGNTSLKAAMDFEVCISGKEGPRKFEFMKMKDAEEPPAQSFTLKPVCLGEDEDGEPITSCVVRWSGEASAAGTTRLNAAEELGLETLRRLTIEAGESTAHLDDWRKVFYSRHHGDNPGTKRRAFTRTREALLAKGFIQVRDDNYSLLSRPQRDTAGQAKMSRIQDAEIKEKSDYQEKLPNIDGQAGHSGTNEKFSA